MVDLREFSDEVQNQIWSGPCGPNALVSGLELILAQDGINLDLSRNFLYYEARIKGHIFPNEGTYINDLITVASTVGIPLETTWVYDVVNYNNKPSDEAYEEASRFLLTDAVPISPTVEAIKLELDKGNPLIFGISLSWEFSYLEGDLNLHTYDGWSEGGVNDYLGEHAMLIVGYDEDQFIVENSWGTFWGDGGYWGMPFTMLPEGQNIGARNNNIYDIWALRDFDITPLPPPKAEGLYLDILTKEDIQATFIEDDVINLWLAAVVEDTLYFKNYQNKWVEWDGRGYTQYVTHQPRETVIDISGDIQDVSPYSGSEIYIGFGTQQWDMEVIHLLTVPDFG